jgi:YD repeat-containing protein
MNKSAKMKKIMKFAVYAFVLLFSSEVFSADTRIRWYAGSTRNELYDSAEEACRSYDMASIGYPFLNYEGVRYSDNGQNANCLHYQTPGVLVNIVNAAIRYVNFYTSRPPNNCPTTEGNPCDLASGAKLQTEVDYSSPNKGLMIKRYYNSQGLNDGYKSLGIIWRHNYTKRINGFGYPDYNNTTLKKSRYYLTPELACTRGWANIRSGNVLLSGTSSVYRDGVCEVSLNGVNQFILPIHSAVNGRVDLDTSINQRFYKISRGNGEYVTFRTVDNSWKSFRPSRYSLSRIGMSWQLVDSAGNTEIYDSSGYLKSSKTSSGETTRFSYNRNGRLLTVTGPFGDTLTYHYSEEGYLTGITTPDGEITYGYDPEGRLNKVTYFDGSERHYYYEDPNYTFLLTGITDENGNRYATWAYDDEGRVILSEHAGNAERVEFSYNPDGTTTVTDAAGAERIYHFTVQQGQMKVDHIEGDRCTTCSRGDIQAYTYDSNGFVASKTDWNGNTTTYTRDSQGRELTRIEASGTTQARTITTTWNTTLNKPLTVTEPEQRTVYTYDTEGRLLSHQQSPIQ